MHLYGAGLSYFQLFGLIVRPNLEVFCSNSLPSDIGVSSRLSTAPSPSEGASVLGEPSYCPPAGFVVNFNFNFGAAVVIDAALMLSLRLGTDTGGGGLGVAILPLTL